MFLSGGFDFGQCLPSLFPFSDPAPPDRLLLGISSPEKTDSPLGNDTAGVLIGMILESAALADELGLGRPVVRMNVPASGAFLRTVVRGNLDHDLPGSFGLLRKEDDEQAPAGRQDRSVKTSLGSCSVFEGPS